MAPSQVQLPEQLYLLSSFSCNSGVLPAKHVQLALICRSAPCAHVHYVGGPTIAFLWAQEEHYHLRSKVNLSGALRSARCK